MRGKQTRAPGEVIISAFCYTSTLGNYGPKLNYSVITSFHNSFNAASIPTLPDFGSAFTPARQGANEAVDGTVEVAHPDRHTFHLLRTADRLTQRCRSQGKRHVDLLKVKKHYELIHSHQKTTE